MITIHEHKSAVVLMDNRRRLATARKKVNGGWLITAYGLSWTDPAARKPNVFGFTDPSMIIVKSKREAAAMFHDMATAGGNTSIYR